MFGLFLETTCCPDGVALYRRPEIMGPTLAHGMSGGDVFKCRTERRGPRRREIESLEDPIVVAFMNADDDDSRAEFLSKYGLLVPGDEISHSEVLRSQDSFAQLLARIHHRKPAAAVLAVNDAIAAHSSFNLRPTLKVVGKTPQMALGCRTLTAFMLMEVALIASHGVRTTRCQHCHSMFLTGPLTWRRSHAKFCSDRCRVAAMRERSKGLTSG
jgi:hypothetical protein